MPRYIDADKFIAHLKDELKECEIPLGSRANGKGIAYGTALGLKSAISFADTLSTADVVPKSEVEEAEAEIERLKHILDCYALQYGTVKDQQDVIDKANQELAREIFAEIERLMLDGAIGGKYPAKVINPDKYAELKKKYTEETK